MVEKVRKSRGALTAGATVGSVAVGGATAAFGVVPPELMTATGTSAVITAAVTWLVARLVGDLFWLRALSRPSAITEQILKSGTSTRETIRILELVLAAQQDVLRARSAADRRPE